MKPYVLLIGLLLLFSCQDIIENNELTFSTVFEDSNGEKTADYEQTIAFYLSLAKEFPEINVQTLGETDSGYPLHLVTYNLDGNFNFQKIRESKSILLINNGIHPGESDGIDATMMLFRDFAQEKLSTPKNVVVATIPVYNVGGMLNRNSTTRVNQNGPEAYGFRGNAQNYDLNRDFIKMDTKNSRTFSTIFHLVKPDVFIDNHVSNGADYQYTLTHLITQHNKLGEGLGEYLNTELMPSLEQKLAKDSISITPYVNVFNRPPDGGFSQFMDHPRYSTGYTTLFNTLGMMVETHMLKPYKQRVEQTYQLMEKMVEIVENDHSKIKSLRADAQQRTLEATNYFLNWSLDTTKTTPLHFKGFKADTILSKITGLLRLKYDRNQPFEKTINYKNFYLPKDTIAIPEGYLIKRGWQKVIDRLTANEVEFFELDTDTMLTVESYKIQSFETYASPYEGHYPHYNTKVSSTLVKQRFEKGDYFVPSQQPALRYIMETLEPEAVDSFFNWNFFDTVLQQKEGFSPYVFEDLALEILEENPHLKDSLAIKKENDLTFSQNWYAQLDWIFKQSKYYETAHMQYPVYRILKGHETEFLLKD